MIMALRLDEDLINSQSINGWCESLAADSIIIANDQLVTDGVSSMVQKMAVPRNIKVAIKELQSALVLLQDPSFGDLKILIIVDTPGDLLLILEQLPAGIPVYVGTYGRNNAGHSDAVQLAPGFRVTADEIKLFQKVFALQEHTVFQRTAAEEPVPLGNLLQENNIF
ncbi:PTS sugar transporter subunit IIB [Breznakiella homolactica]|uniref:PTS sugar transporter subunit IIB n=1 Tax=Breznakiella homolactica TaxID=2798577 RepID=A0A7T7XKK2_9SPIR|nr:PTS sugar transporter subunit IIB [Breznakiella homolactica]QQO08114.1 PTS sugar transporter subunit IIB [Breznakiella homolactica]